MARKFIKRFIPSSATIKEHPSLRFLGKLLHDPNLFHLNRHSVSVAFFVGIFVAFIPIPFQMPVAACGALLFRCNLPISVALVWITNPLTMPPIYFACYQLGRWMLQLEPSSINVEFTLEWISNKLILIWEPLLLGCLTCGLVFGALGYLVMRYFWRWQVIQTREKRKKRRAARQRLIAKHLIEENDHPHKKH